MNEFASLYDWAAGLPADDSSPEELRLHAVSTRSAPDLLPHLLLAMEEAGGWVLQHGLMGPSMLQVRVEAQGRCLMGLYAAFMMESLELSRDSHLLMTERCTCAQLHRETGSNIISLRLHISLPVQLPRPLAWWNHGTA